MPGGLTGSSITVSPADTTVYSVAVNDGTGCVDTAYVTVYAKEIPASSFTVTPANACLGTSQTVTYTGNAPAGATYNWFGFAGATVQNGTGQGPYSILFNSAGRFVIQLQVTNNGCSSGITSLPDTVFAPVTAAFAVSDSVVCQGANITATFTGSAPNTATAAWGWGGGTVQSGTGLGPFTVQYNRTGIVSLTVKNGVCSSTANSKLITVVPVPVAAFTPDITAGCLPVTVTFTNQTQSGNAYKWHFGDGDSATAVNPVHTYNAVGVYTVTLTAASQNKCFDTLGKTNLIQVKAVPVADFTLNPGFNNPLELHLATFAFSNSSQNAGLYKWDFGDGDSSRLTSPSHKYRYAGNYIVTLYAMNDIGCTDTAVRAYVMVLPDKALDIPNAFSPNGDGINDRWDIAGLMGSTDCEVEVFNRWGQKVYASTHGYASPWDGKFNGKPVPVASYYYVIKTATRSYNGWVAVIR
jgi:gliding motility-associated-like protein